MNEEMKTSPRLRLLTGDERGSVLVLFALLLVVLLGMVALAIDIGLLMSARTESQRVADSSALAGAGRLLASSQDEDGAREEAIRFASLHAIRQQTAVVLPEDVEVFLGEQRVRVTVRNTVERGNAIPTIFGRVLGRQTFNVVSVAMAEAAEAGLSTSCDLPLALPDKWEDLNSNRKWDGMPPDFYDYENRPNWEDGELVELKLQPAASQGGGPPACNEGPDLWDPCNAYEDDSWRCWWLPYPDGTGEEGWERNEDLRRRIHGECPNDEEVWTGEYAYATPGNAQALLQDLAEYVDQYVNEEGWNQNLRCPTSIGNVNSSDPAHCIEDSGLLRSVPLIRPDGVEGSGNQRQAEIISRVGVYLEKVSCSYTHPDGHRGGPAGQWNLYVRFTDAPGEGVMGPSTSDPTVKVLRLIE